MDEKIDETARFVFCPLSRSVLKIITARMFIRTMSINAFAIAYPAKMYAKARANKQIKNGRNLTVYL